MITLVPIMFHISDLFYIILTLIPFAQILYILIGLLC